MVGFELSGSGLVCCGRLGIVLFLLAGVWRSALDFAAEPFWCCLELSWSLNVPFLKLVWPLNAGNSGSEGGCFDFACFDGDVAFEFGGIILSRLRGASLWSLRGWIPSIDLGSISGLVASGLHCTASLIGRGW